MRKIAIKTIALQVDEKFHQEIKKKLAENGKTLKMYIIDLIREDLSGSPTDNSIPAKLDAIISLLKQIADK